MSYGGVCLNFNRKAIFRDADSEHSEPIIGQNILSIQQLLIEECQIMVVVD